MMMMMMMMMMMVTWINTDKCWMHVSIAMAAMLDDQCMKCNAKDKHFETSMRSKNHDCNTHDI